MSFIRFVDYNADGCGTNIEKLVMVRTNGITNGQKERLQRAVCDIKSECEDWDFDSVVAEACEKVFGHELKYTYIYPEAEIEL